MMRSRSATSPSRCTICAACASSAGSRAFSSVVEPQHFARLRIEALPLARRRRSLNNDNAGCEAGSASAVRAATTTKYIASGGAAGATLRTSFRVSAAEHFVSLAPASSRHSAEPRIAPLAQPALRRKGGIEQRGRAPVAIELVQVERIAVAAHFGVLGRLGDDRTTKPRGASTRANSAIIARLCLARQMLDGLERHHDVHARVGQRQRGRGARREAQVGMRRSCAAACATACGVDVDARHVGGRAGEQRAAVAFAARDVQTRRPATKRRGERIAVPVLVRDLAELARHEALAGELEASGLRPVGRGLRPIRVHRDPRSLTPR